MEYRHVITHETDAFAFGHTLFVQNGVEEERPLTTFCRYKRDAWFIGPPHVVLARLGVETTPKRAQEFVDLIDGDLDGFHYVAAATPSGTGDEALKWIMGSLAAVLNERGLSFDRVAEVLPADYLAAFVRTLTAGRFDRSFAKDIFSDLIRAERFEWERFSVVIEAATNRDISDIPWEEWVARSGHVDCLEGEDTRPVRRLTGDEVIAAIVADPRYELADTTEIDAIIERVIAANPDNAAKVAQQPKLVQWFVGQTMKAAKGKAPAPVILAKLQARFGISL